MLYAFFGSKAELAKPGGGNISHVKHHESHSHQIQISHREQKFPQLREVKLSHELLCCNATVCFPLCEFVL